MLLAAAAGGAHATGFVNGGFEAGTSSGWDSMNATNTPGWVINTGASNFFPALNLNQACGGPYGGGNEGCQFATIGGTEDGATSSLQQTISGFTVGNTYTLSWIQASEFVTADTLDVNIGGTDYLVTSPPYPGGTSFWYGWNSESVTFVANASSETFHFQSASPTGYELGLDNFSVDVAAVPEPATWALMLVGFGGLGAALRVSRRRQAVAA